MVAPTASKSNLVFFHLSLCCCNGLSGAHICCCTLSEAASLSQLYQKLKRLCPWAAPKSFNKEATLSTLVGLVENYPHS